MAKLALHGLCALGVTVAFSAANLAATPNASNEGETKNAASGKKFVVFDNMNLGQPDTKHLGMLPINCFDERGLRRPDSKAGKDLGNEDFLEGKLPDKDKFLALIRNHAEKNPGPICMDFEKIFLKDKRTVKKRVHVFVTLAQWAKEAAPGRLVGYWGEGGDRLFPEDPGKNREEVKPLTEAVTAFFPNFYVWHDTTREGWHKQLKETMALANKIAPKKPVYIYLSPTYYGGKNKGKRIEGDFWQFQLESAKKCGADGVVIWGFARDRTKWDNDAPWWQQTLQFMKTLNEKGT